MTRIGAACVVLVAVSVLTLLWVAIPVIQVAVPVWVIVDALVAQLIIGCALSGLVRQ